MEYNEILFSAHSCAIAGEYTTEDMAAGDTVWQSEYIS
jgi:hypothetical protein